MKRLCLVLVVLFAVAFAGVVPSVLADAPMGAGPSDPLMMTGAWQTLPANGTQWFYFDYTGDQSRIRVVLDDNDAANITLSIYTPALARQWVQDPTTAPIGRGTQPAAKTSDGIHDLTWQGSFNAPGRYFVVVANGNPDPIQFRLFAQGDNVALGPTPTTTPRPTFVNPLATPVPQGTVQGRLLFQGASGGVIYSVNGDGSNLTRVTMGIDPAWSPNHQRIAFTRWSQPAGVFVANADGTGETTLIPVEKALSPQWSPDGTRVAYTHQSGGTVDDKQLCFFTQCFSIVADPHWKIGVVDTSAGKLSEPRVSNHPLSPTWSQDGHTLVYADSTFGILMTDAAPNSGPASNLYTQNTAVQSTRYSPDGSKIAFMARQNDHWEIAVMSQYGGAPASVTSADPLSFDVVNNVAPAWSPDGKQILFLSDRHGKWEFYVINLDGSGLTQVLKNVTGTFAIRYNFSNERVIDWAP